MKNYHSYRFFYACLLLLISVSQAALAQQHPVQASLMLTPPYSVYLADYAIPGSEQLKLHLLLRDAAEADYPVALHLIVEGNGIRLETNPAFQPPPIYLPGGLPIVLSGEDLAPYLAGSPLINPTA